jgi:photosystem II stability/assembly factor-like uncharacterized protein
MRNKVFYVVGVLSIAIVAILLLPKEAKKDQTISHELSKKGRSIQGALEYYQTIKGNLETGEIDYNLVSQAYADANKLKSQRAGSMNMQWISRGPDNVGGRTRALCFDKDDNNILYTGGVSGGIFKSTNGGQSWERKVYDAEIGGLTVNFITQTTEGTLFASTGEMFFNAMSGPNGNLVSGSRGGGIYRSTDKGETWELLDATNPNFTQWYSVQKVVASPTEPKKAFAATYRGLYVTTDNGENWEKINTPSPSNNHTFIDLVVSPDGQTVYAVSYSSSRCALYRSKDAGNSFTRVASDMNDITNSTRVTLAISDKNPDYVYVLAASNGADDGNNGFYSFGGLMRSTDNGDNWELLLDGGISLDPFGTSQFQGQYNNCIGIDPDNENRVFVGGVDFYAWNNGQWYKVASRSDFLDADKTQPNPYYVHADKHNIYFDTRSTPKKMFVVTDGGIAVSENYTQKYPTYKTLNLYFTTTQFYSVAVTRYGDIIGGTQDNGCLKIEYDGLSGNSAVEILGNDGLYTEISKVDPNIYFSAWQEGHVYRSKDKGENQEIMINYETGTDFDENFHFNTPYRIWERKYDTTMFIKDFIVRDPQGNPIDTTERQVDTSIHESLFFLTSKTGLRVSQDAVDFTADTIDWFEVSPTVNQQIISVEYANDGDVVFLGTRSFTEGRLYRVSGLRNAKYKHDAEGNFYPDSVGIKTELLQSFNGRVVTGIGVSPSNNNTVVVTLGNYSSNNDRVFISNNALDSAHLVNFTSIQGNLPNFPVYDAVINSQSNNQDTIVIATELGIWATNDGGNTWTEENEGDMQRAPVFMLKQLKYNPWDKGYTIFAASHGMGIFQSTTFAPNVSVPEAPQKEFEYTLITYPNPARNLANLFFELDNDAIIRGQIFNLSGQVVQDIPVINAVKGENRYQVNTSKLVSGNYIIRLYSEDFDMTSRLLIVK